MRGRQRHAIPILILWDLSERMADDGDGDECYEVDSAKIHVVERQTSQMNLST